jgi:nitrate reductase gamma subunit
VSEVRTFLAVVLPYAALLTFVIGISVRVLRWARSPVPFRIPTTCGQERSLPWIRSSWLESPAGGWAAACRVMVEALTFRSLWRNQQAERRGSRLLYGPSPLLWLAALTFHWSLAAILVRHLRLFLNPVPKSIAGLMALDGFFQAGMPVVYATDVAILAALLYLTGRRLFDARVRYLSLPADYAALFLLLSVAGSGILLRYFFRTDVAAVKTYALSLVSFAPRPPSGAGALFYTHLALVSLLVAWLPFSKLVHMAGIFLSPTRNLANNSRAKRHINPWNYEVRVHTYEEWEDEFREKMKSAGLPVEKA